MFPTAYCRVYAPPRRTEIRRRRKKRSSHSRAIIRFCFKSLGVTFCCFVGMSLAAAEAVVTVLPHFPLPPIPPSPTCTGSCSSALPPHNTPSTSSSSLPSSPWARGRWTSCTPSWPCRNPWSAARRRRRRRGDPFPENNGFAPRTGSGPRSAGRPRSPGRGRTGAGGPRTRPGETSRLLNFILKNIRKEED